MLIGTFDLASAQEPLAVAGLVFAGAGAILWFGSFTLLEADRRWLRQFATALGLLSPVFLAWPILIETGTVTLWVLIGFFIALLAVVLLANLLLPRLRPLLPHFIKRHLIESKERPENGDGKHSESDTQEERDRGVNGEHVSNLEPSVSREWAFAFAVGAAAGALVVRWIRDRAA